MGVYFFQKRVRLQLSIVESLSEGHTVGRDSWSERVHNGPVSALTSYFSCSVVSSGRGRGHLKTLGDKMKHKDRQKGWGKQEQPAGPALTTPSPGKAQTGEPKVG